MVCAFGDIPLTYPFLVKPAEVLVVINEVPDSEKGSGREGMS